MAQSHRSILNFIYFSLSFILFTQASCTLSKKSYYFKTLTKDTTISGFVTNDFESKIKPGDNLNITATSLSKEEDVIFNSASGEISSMASAVNPGFLVRPDGTILTHKLGNIKAEGLTRKEFALVLQKALLPYMKDPVVNVTYLNHKVTVMGSISKPQILNFTEDQVPLIDVLIMSGDILQEGNRNDVIVIREEGNQKKVKHLNLEDLSIFNSSWYYTQPNDIVYVTKNFKEADKIERRTRVTTTLSLVATTISLIILILSRL